jgi:hypothetical protein
MAEPDPYANGDNYAPKTIIFVEDDEVEIEIMRDVKEMTYEESTSMTTEVKIELVNTDGRYTDSVMWGPGNEVELWLGYMGDVQFLGRCELTRHTPIFPADGIMTLRLRGLDKTWRMKRQELKLKGGRTPRKADRTTRKYEGTVAGFVKQVAKKYGLKTDIARKFYKIKDKFLQKKGQTDYQILSALANFYRALLKAEYRIDTSNRSASTVDAREATPGGAWYLVFDDYDYVTQQKMFTFRHVEGDESTIVEIEFEMSVEDNLTEVQAYYWDPLAEGTDGKKGGWRVISEEEHRKVYTRHKIKAAGGEDASPDGYKWKPVKEKDGTIKKNADGSEAWQEETKKVFVRDTDPFHRSYRSQRRKVRRGDQHPTKLRLAIAGHSVEILTKPFRNAEEAKQFVKKWVKENKDNFITAKGILPGVLIHAGETHQIEGGLIGKRYDGWYFFNMVRQEVSDAGWLTHFSAHKVFQPAWAPSATGETLVTGDEFTIAVDSPSAGGE